MYRSVMGKVVLYLYLSFIILKIQAAEHMVDILTRFLKPWLFKNVWMILHPCSIQELDIIVVYILKKWLKKEKNKRDFPVSHYSTLCLTDIVCKVLNTFTSRSDHSNVDYVHATFVESPLCFSLCFHDHSSPTGSPTVWNVWNVFKLTEMLKAALCMWKVTYLSV